MEYYSQFTKMGRFTREEAAERIGNIRTADSILQSYKKRGLIDSVRRNLYVAINPETDAPVCNAFEIASGISEDGTISHHSAFEYYGMANQIYNEIYVSSDKRFASFEYNGKTYLRVAPNMKCGVTVNGRIRVTDLERTIIDSIKDFHKIGGLEELLNCLDMATFVNEKTMIEYLDEIDIFGVWQKCGFLLSLFPNMKISDTFFDICKEKSKKHPRYLYEELREEKTAFIPDWNLFVPVNLPRFLA